MKLIGVSNMYDVETLEMLEDESGVKPDVVQNRWYKGNGWDKNVVRWCTANDVRYE